MKKIFRYLVLALALTGIVSACDILNPVIEPADIGLGIKVFFPTKVVTNQPMTINGSGFRNATEVVFPNGVVVTNFEIVSNDMIRVNAPAGIAAEGGKIIVRTADEQVESPLPLTVGKTVVSGFSKQAGEEISGGEQITIYGTDLEFINGIELLDADGNPVVLTDAAFYRKGTSSVVITIPKKVFEGTFTGKLFTYDGQEILMPELAYKPAADGGHWETKQVVIWENPDPDGNGPANWNGLYRFCLEGTDTNPAGKECIAEIPAETWEKMKTGKFYMQAKGSDWVQMRIVTGWWNFQWPTAEDVTTGNEMIIDNEDGTYYIELDLAGSDLAANMDVQHLLFTGSGFTPLKLYFLEEEWIEGGGHMEIVKDSIWKNPDPDGNGPANWNGLYRFCLEGTDTNPAGKECIAEIPAETWERIKTEKFYMLAKGSDWVQMRIVTGWWNFQWPTADDVTTGNEMIIDNGDGTYYIELNLAGSDLAANMDEQHLLFTGSGFTPLELYFEEEVWVGGDTGPKEINIWNNPDPDGNGPANWNGLYRFCLEGTDTNPAGKECIAEIPAETWEKMKTGKFYMQAKGSDWVQMRIVTGWWNFQWPTAEDVTTGNEMIIDNGDGTYYIELNLAGSDLVANMDEQHLLFTGSGYTPLKLYFLE